MLLDKQNWSQKRSCHIDDSNKTDSPVKYWTDWCDELKQVKNNGPMGVSSFEEKKEQLKCKI